jgi:hypothetical protein
MREPSQPAAAPGGLSFKLPYIASPEASLPSPSVGSGFAPVVSQPACGLKREAGFTPAGAIFFLEAEKGLDMADAMGHSRQPQHGKGCVGSLTSE